MHTKAKLKFYNGKLLIPSQASCLLTISVGQLNHEEERLLSTLHSINKTFKDCHIFICDTLQRFNLKLTNNISEHKAFEKAHALGDLWIERNQSLMDELNIPHSFSRWETWLNHKDFHETYLMMLEQFNSNKSFRVHMEKTINDFYNRRKQSFQNITFERLYQCSLQYLLEECAVQKIISAYDFHYELYPSKRNPILTYCYENFIYNVAPHKLIPVCLKFSSKKLAA